MLSRARAGEHYRELIQKVESQLAERIVADAPLEASPAGRVSRWVKHFPIDPQVAIMTDRRPGHWLVTVSCADRPGLLSSIARLFLKHGLNLIDARVTTLGARAEDAFVVDGDALDDPDTRASIVAELCKTAA
ncbi:MAG: ACT domain-containing protein [Usitatibacter sp.]